jgi:tRNA pseudouridine13 synthase
MPETSRVLPDWHHAHGRPVLEGIIKQTPGDFRVTENLGFKPSGDGDHDFLWVRKSGANTSWVARALARHAGVPARDIGYSGMKDRHAVTYQWFSVPRPPKDAIDWTTLDLPDTRIDELARHRKKLKRGSHDSNHFLIRVRCACKDKALVEDRLALLSERGVPNYFGEQRFGHNGSNLNLAAAVFGGAKIKRDKRSIALSAARSFLFNEVLSERISDMTWDTPLTGDAMNLDGTGSFFTPGPGDEEVRSRNAQMDIHPTGPLWGRGKPSVSDTVEALERHVAQRHSDFASGLEHAGLQMDRRSLRLRASQLEWNWIDGGLELRFTLGRGGYATSVLREIVELPNR